MKNSHNCDCNCGCQNPRVYTPLKIFNSVGQPSLAYRIGTHAQFKSDMLLSALSEKTLGSLKTREDSDLSVALVDSWALIADVLTFYQERIANEGFIDTATERRSILELARTIGYELKPGVAASTTLAFSMDSAVGSPKEAKIATGTKVQSIPAQGQLPQIFETMEEIEAHQGWNEIKPQQAEKQDLKTALSKGAVVLAGISTKLKAGDCLLFVIGGTKAAFVEANQVQVDAKNQLTRVFFDKDSPTSDSPDLSQTDNKQQQADTIVDSKSKLSRSDICKLLQTTWTEQDLQSKATVEGWSMDDIVDTVNSERERLKSDTAGDTVYVFRIKCGIFGNSAPKWDSLPPEQRHDYPPAKAFTKRGAVKTNTEVPYKTNWDSGNGIEINKNSSGTNYSEKGDLIYLDNTYPAIQAKSWIILRGPSKASGFRVSQISEASVAGFAITAKVSGLTLGLNETSDWIKLNSPGTSPDKDLEGYYFRTTTVYGAPEKLELAQVPIESAVDGNELMLDTMVGGLSLGRPIALTGELDGQPGIFKREVSVIAGIFHFQGGKLLTTLTLLKPLQYKYRRDTLKINANTAKATHGDTKQVSIGSGDPTLRFQEFSLKHSPLTFVSSAASPTGIASTLEVTVDGVRWTEVESFEGLGPRDSAYVVKMSDDSKTAVIMGDGDTGRLPSAGRENVKANYRVGIGSAGLLDADQLSILMTRPLGVKGVTNPLKTSGAEDPESLDSARKNAPRTVLTMDRIVSLEDYKSFAERFAGIGKATSYRVSIGGTEMVLLAVSGENGEPIDTDLHDNLAQAVESFKDPTAQFTLRSFKLRTFDVEAKILVSSDREFQDVQDKVKAALKNAFSFDNRDFGQAVTISEVTSVIQSVEGVEAVDIEWLYEHKDSSSAKTREYIIRAKGVEDDDGDSVVIPSLLLINKDKITIEEMQKRNE